MIPNENGARDKLSAGQVWSLHDVLSLNARSFLDAAMLLEETRTYLDALMERDEEIGKDKVVGGEVSEFISGACTSLSEALIVLDAKITKMAVDRLLVSMEGGRVTFGKLTTSLTDIKVRLSDELSIVQVFVIDTARVKLLTSTSPLFGEGVEASFSVASDDIAEAGKCLAMGRGTAAVFHLMRVMEAGLMALAADLGIPYAPSWESYRKKLDIVLDSANYKDLTEHQKGQRPLYQSVLGDIIAIKTAWRNPTMHIVKSYDVEQASIIFDATKAFMQRLATNLKPSPLSVISTGQVAP